LKFRTLTGLSTAIDNLHSLVSNLPAKRSHSRPRESESVDASRRGSFGGTIAGFYDIKPLKEIKREGNLLRGAIYSN